MELIVGGETFRPAEKLAPTDVLQKGYSVHCVFEHRHELIVHVPFEFFKRKVIRYTVLPPGNGIRFKCADQ